MGSDKPFTFKLEVPFASQADADTVRKSLAVDPELQPDKVAKVLSCEGEKLVADFAATEARLLRAAVAAFLDLLKLATRTLEKFGPTPAQ